MMKNKAHAPIKGLLFRELYMGRNTYISITAIFFGIMLLCVLVLLSLDFGERDLSLGINHKTNTV